METPRSLTKHRIRRNAGAPARLTVGPADEPVTRDAGMPTASSGASPTSLLRLVHITDFQHGDLASPMRNDYLQKYAGQDYWARLLPAYRPQEFLQWHALATVVRTVNAMQDITELRADLLLCTGDATDSSQVNELRDYLSLMDGGTVHPGRHTAELTEAPSFGTDTSFWLPETPEVDRWKDSCGLPHIPGIRAVAAAAFEHEGLRIPWLTCFGNHDQLIQGRHTILDAETNGRVDAYLEGTHKPSGTRDPASLPGDAMDQYLEDPLIHTPGEQQQITADADRRIVSRREYMQAHLDAADSAVSIPGRGFSRDNVENDTAYYVYDGHPGIRFITLDTTNTHGDVDGCLGEEQFRWFEERLREVHSTYRLPDGSEVRHDVVNRLVVLVSHHGSRKLTNDYGQERAYLQEDVLQLLSRFDNVVLWMNGHTHVNEIEARGSGSAAFWEITTSAVAEWPVQLRHLEVSCTAEGGVEIRTRMIDSEAPTEPELPLPESLEDPVAYCAGLHRWVGANDAGSVGGLNADGEPRDRTARLLASVPPETAADVLSEAGEASGAA